MSTRTRDMLTSPVWQALDSPIIEGDCVETMRTLPDASVDAVVTDPPYGLSREPDVVEVFTHWVAGDDYQHRGGGFMGQTWDSFVPGPAVWREALRVLKPGGHLLAFGGTRTFDLLAVALRMAGFEVRDTLMYCFGNGFPKSLDVSKAIDRELGAAREVVGTKLGRPGYSLAENRDNRTVYGDFTDAEAECAITAPATPEAAAWEGWGTALKPAFEPIVLARKPLDGTVAQNVLKHGTGALNIDGCRIPAPGGRPSIARRREASKGASGWTRKGGYNHDAERYAQPRPGEEIGRWPANILLDGQAGAMLDGQAGESRSRPGRPRTGNAGNGWGMTVTGTEYDDEGGPSRFFYTAKASSWERNVGTGHLPQRAVGTREGEEDDLSPGKGPSIPRGNTHPTVKPIALMAWLLRLVTPPGGLVVDPFAGSGSTVCAGATEGITVVGIEREPEYVEVARARAAWWAAHPRALVKRPQEEKPVEGALSLLDLLDGEAAA